MNDWPYPQLLAHRGGGRLAPENTVVAMETGKRYGYSMIEIDAKLSADQQVFLLHDDYLERTTNDHGVASDLPWHDLVKLDAGSWFAPEFKGEHLPLLADVADHCRHHSMMINIEIKPSRGTDKETARQVALAAQRLWSGMTVPLLSSFSVDALQVAQDIAPELPRGLLLGSLYDGWEELARGLGCVSLHVQHDGLTPERVAAIKTAKLRVLAYTVNDPCRAAELLKWGVDTICTDALDVIKAIKSGC